MLVASKMFCDGKGSDMDGGKCMYMYKDTPMPHVIGGKRQSTSGLSQMEVYVLPYFKK